ncbi:MAG: wax ester/triacylglycerol synthase family O-acyltransferase [Nocardioides sp.]|nr:wax ester/triacylglycerol synthase family O-acyltransferase [Nocardioides sp.]
MKRLSGTDSLFLSMETPSWHQHVGGLTVLEPGPRGLSYADILASVEQRIGYAPKFTWKLASTPLGLDRPVWVDDPDFDVRQHVNRIGVPSPGGAREVGEVCGMLLSSQLDRSRPLWEIWVLEGLAGGRTGILMKYHHCLLDGLAGAGLATALLDLEPDADGPLVPFPSAEESTAGDRSALEVLGGIASRWATAPLSYGRYGAGLAAKGATMLTRVVRDDASRTMLPRVFGPRTPLNATVGHRRQLAFASVAMADVRRLKDAHGVKVNDVVLALCGTALRGYLADRGELPDAPLTSGVPLSTRVEGDDTLDNQVTTMFVSLATDLDDPVERLLAIHASSLGAKDLAEATGARRVESLGKVAAPLLVGSAVRALYASSLMSRGPFCVNTLVSNVPGPPVDLYMCGAKVTGIYPSSVILEGMGTNFTVLSNMDRLDFGLHVDPDLVPDPWTIADAIPRALAELFEASGLGSPTPVADPFAVPEAKIAAVTIPAPRHPRATAKAGV